MGLVAPASQPMLFEYRKQAEWCQAYQVAIWAWCLRGNHVHLIAVPTAADGLARAIGEACRRYTGRITYRKQWRGHLWSSAQAHLAGQDDKRMQATPLLSLVSNWRAFLQLTHPDEVALLQRHERTGRPLGSDNFIETLEIALCRRLHPQKPGPKGKLT